MRKVDIARLAALSAAWVVVDRNDGADKIRISIIQFQHVFPVGAGSEKGR
jgi:hypothetical protein